VSALTKPEDAFARRDPKSLSGPIYDRWYCTPYPQAIALQLTEAIPHSQAEQIRQVSQNEGAVLTRIEGTDLPDYAGGAVGLGAGCVGGDGDYYF
jgi:putative ABC transport system permease protein